MRCGAALLQVARRALAARPPVPVLLDGQVLARPGIRAVPQQNLLLGWCRLKTVPGHAGTLAAACDIPHRERRKRHFLPSLKIGVSTPQR
jgi:hypothetical protein